MKFELYRETIEIAKNLCTLLVIGAIIIILLSAIYIFIKRIITKWKKIDKIEILEIKIKRLEEQQCPFKKRK